MSDTPAAVLISAEELAELRRRLQWAELKVQVLEEQLRKERIRKYGPFSEKLSDLQLSLLEGEPGVSLDEVQAEAAREPLPAAPAPPAGQRRAHPGRQTLPAHLPRVVREIACAPADGTCGRCGAERTVVGYDESEQLEVEPARYFVVVTRREKRACPRCADGVKAAPLPERIVDKSLVSDRIIVDALVAKYSDHLPLYRQSVILERETGLKISRATMDGWVMRVGELLQPVVGAMRRELLGAPYLQADETPVAVQVRDGTGSNHKAYLWQYGQPAAGAVFDFRMGRGREGPRDFLDSFDGILQSDGYVAYDDVGGKGMVRAGCWAHARRKFVEAVKVNPRDAAAARLVGRMDALFAVDAAARAAGLDVEQRHQMRQAQAVEILAELKTDLEGIEQSVLPASALGKGVHYALAQWGKLVQFLDHPVLELSNNLAENSMRPVALGRKNWLHIGSPAAGPKVAAILSVIESCRRLGILAREYLAAILPGLADLTIQQAAQLTPAAWLAAQKTAATSRT